MNERLPFRDVRSTVPLTDDELASIRAAVRRRIEQSERGAWAWPARLTYAAVVVAVVAIALVLLPHGDRRTGVTRQVIHRRGPAPAPAVAAVMGVPAATATSTPDHARSVTHQPRAASTRIASQPSHRRHHLHRQAPAPHERERVLTAAAPMRLELHTSNPDIRIIWITTQ